jgi:hypothetical protein
MDNLLAKYFDGDFNDDEARAFLDAVASDPKLEKELRAYERVLSLSQRLPMSEAPAGFTKRVMADVTAETRRERSRGWLPWFSLRWAAAAAAAAIVVMIAFFGGRLTVTGPPVEPAVVANPVVTQAEGEALTVFTGEATTAPGLRSARLVYLPSDPSVEQVEVAGSFNGWNPSATPMSKQDGVWHAVLVLPPGNYEYMFVVDGKRWVTDPLAVATHDDGFGGSNAVLDLSL